MVALTSPKYGDFYASTVRAAGDVLTAEQKAEMRTTSQILMQFGDPFPGSFPNEEVPEALALALEKEPDRVLQYGAGTSASDLRSFILQRARQNGMEVQREQLLVTNGSSEGIDLLCRLFLDPGDLIMTEAPTFMGALSIFRNFGVEVEGCDMDEGGLKTDLLEEQLARRSQGGGKMPKFLYIIPNFQNPTGTTMTTARRIHLLELADRYNLLIVCDDAYQELRLEGEDVPTLWDMDESGRIIHLGTFSKTLAPGLRLGWVFAPTEITAQLGKLKPGYGNAVAESLAGEYCCNMVDFDQRLAGLRDFYRGRRDVVLTALEQYMPEGVRWNRPEGGLFIWLKLPDGHALEHFIEEASRRGVAVLSGAMFFPDERDTRDIRLSYSLESRERLEIGVKIMADVIREMR